MIALVSLVSSILTRVFFFLLVSFIFQRIISPALQPFRFFRSRFLRRNGEFFDAIITFGNCLFWFCPVARIRVGKKSKTRLGVWWWGILFFLFRLVRFHINFLFSLFSRCERAGAEGKTKKIWRARGYFRPWVWNRRRRVP